MLLKLSEDRRTVPGVALGGVWVGDSDSERMTPCGALLNVAQDLNSLRGWPAVEAMHVGLADGPGNEPAAYAAAVLALHALLHRHNVLVFCHTGGRSLAVALMYFCATTGRSWEECLRALEERVEGLPRVNGVHREAWIESVKGLLEKTWTQ